MRARTTGVFVPTISGLIAVSLACTDKPVFSGTSFDSDPPTAGRVNGYFVATNNGDDTLSVIDPGTRQLKWRVPVGFIPVELEGPHHIVAAPAGDFFYINLSESVVGSGSGPHGAHGTGTIPGYVLKLSSQTAEQVAFARVDPNPGDLTISADGKTLYVTHYDLQKLLQAVRAGDIRQGDSNLAVIDTTSMTVKQSVPLCPLAHGVRLSADGQTLYSTCGTDQIAIVNLTNASVERLSLPGTVESPNCAQCPYALSVAPDGTVWVSNLGPPDQGVSGRGSVQVYDPLKHNFDPARTISLCGRALFAAFTSVPPAMLQYRLYVPEQGRCGDWIREYRVESAGQAPIASGQLLLPPSDCLNAHMLMTSSDGATGYLVCEGDHSGPGSFVFLDLGRMTLSSSLRAGIFTDGMALIPGSPSP